MWLKQIFDTIIFLENTLISFKTSLTESIYARERSETTLSYSFLLKVMNSGVSIAGLYLVMGTVVHTDDIRSLSQMVTAPSPHLVYLVFQRKFLCPHSTISCSRPCHSQPLTHYDGYESVQPHASYIS